MAAALPVKDQRLDCVKLAETMGLNSPWVIYGVKKANRLLAAEGKEELIFCGRFSTPAKVSAWLDAHPDFVATRTLVPVRQRPTPRGNRSRPQA